MNSKDSMTYRGEPNSKTERLDTTQNPRTPDIISTLNEVKLVRQEALEIEFKFEAYLLELAILSLAAKIDETAA